MKTILIFAVAPLLISILAFPFHWLAGKLPDSKFKFMLLKHRGRVPWLEKFDAPIDGFINLSFSKLLRCVCGRR